LHITQQLQFAAITYQSKVHIWLPISESVNWWLIVTDILFHTVSELSQLIVQILDTAFLSPFGGLGTMYDVHLGLIGKRIVDFLLV